MKKLFAIFSVLLLLSCNKDLNSVSDCRCESPEENLPWLKELIKKAEKDTTGNYKGTIWLINYKGQDMFVTDMMLGSGGLLFHFFDCKGNEITIAGTNGKENLATFIQKLKKATPIYSNIYD